MKKLYATLLMAALTLCTTLTFAQSDLVFTGIISGALPGGLPKALEIYVANDVADLSTYGIANANNGNPSGGVPLFSFPAVSATAGTYIYVASEVDGFTAYFGIAPTYAPVSVLNINGDDALELYHNGVAVDYMGVVGVDGTGEPWEYLKGWMYRNSGTGPNTTFTLSEWMFSGVEAIVGVPTNGSADTPMPVGTYTSDGDVDPSTPLTIVEIQETTDPSGDSPHVGQAVITSGIVTAVANNGFWIQDGEGAWTGIFVRTAEAPTVLMGDDVTIDATVQESNGLTRLNNHTALTVNSSGNALPAPMGLTTGSAGVEDYESVLITIAGATCVDADLGFSEWMINDGSGQYMVGFQAGMYDADPVGFTNYDVTGIAYYSFNNFKILPRVAEDVAVVGEVTGLSFEVSELQVNETDGTVTVNVEITNAAATATSVEVAVTGGTAVLGTHFTFTNPTTLVFDANVTESKSFTFDLVDDDEANENRTITFALQNASSGVVFGNDVLEVTIGDDDTVIEITPIAVAAAVDAEGAAVNLGEIFTITGIVHGVNMNANGLSITVIDATGGVGLYSNTPMSGYPVVTEGDSIVVTGQVDQFNGLTQLSFLTSIEFISSGHALTEPIVVSELNESHESHLVTIECVFIVNPGNWTGQGSGFTVKVENADGTQFDMRIDNDVNLFSAPVPTGTFNLTGLVGQFVYGPPFLSGYQVLPRYLADVEPADCNIVMPLVNDNCSDAISLNTLLGGEVNAPQLSETFTNVNATSENDPGNGWECFTGDGSGALESTVWFSFTGDGNTYFIETTNCNETAENYIADGNTQMAIYSGICGFTVPVLCTEDGPDGSLAAGAELTTVQGQSYLIMIDGYEGAQGEFCIEFTMLEPDGLNDINNFSFDVYPNPAKDRLFVETPIAIQAATLTNVLGQQVKAYGFNASRNVEINVNGLDAGIYILQLRSVDNQISTTKVVVE